MAVKASCDRHDAHWTGFRIEHCCMCGATFSGTTAGDMHQVGDHAVFTGPDRRRCLTRAEMLERGMDYAPNAYGTPIWGTGKAGNPWKSLGGDAPGLRTGHGEGDSLAGKFEAVCEMEASA